MLPTPLTNDDGSPELLTMDDTFASPLAELSTVSFPHSHFVTSPSPCIPPPPPHTLPNVPLWPNGSYDSRTCTNIILSHRDGLNHADARSLSDMFRVLATEMFRVTKDGSLLYTIYEGMQMCNQEHFYTEVLQNQLRVIKRIAYVSRRISAAVKDGTTPSDNQTDKALRCQRDLHTISLDAEASFTVIVGFLSTRAGQGLYSGSSIFSVA